MPDPCLIATLHPAGPYESRKNGERTLALNQNRLPLIDPPGFGVYYYYGGYGGVGSDSGRTATTTITTTGLQLRFDSLRRNQAGFVLGASPDCDVVLLSRSGLLLAPYQCVVAFDSQRRLVLRDLQGAGVAVRYGDKGSQMRTACSWVLSGHKFTEKNTPIVIRLDEHLVFRIEVALHDMDSPAYQASVDSFPDCYDAALNRVPGYIFSTTDDSDYNDNDSAPLGPNSVLLDDRHLGRGGQARVERVWDTRTGIWYASKVPLRDASWRRLKREADLLQRIDHEHVIKLVYVSPPPSPRLVLEYAAYGTVAKLASDRTITRDESLAVVSQCLSALAYLHSGDIVHRDIKPANILVQSRDPLRVKLSDFGYSKDVEEVLKTRVGTGLYMAPEARDAPDAPDGSRYTSAVDIWSLGVVALELTHRLPAYGPRYARKIVRDLGEKKDRRYCPLLNFLSMAMLLLDPLERLTAAECHAAFLHESMSCCPPLAAPDYSEEQQQRQTAAAATSSSWPTQTLVHTDYAECVNSSPYYYGVADVHYTTQSGYAPLMAYSYLFQSQILSADLSECLHSE